ncbi:MAG TPA: hypothetical protein VGA03_03720 [Anaerolineales bacterium]
MAASLAGVKKIDIEIEAFLGGIGEIFRSFRDQDSGCVSYGVSAGGRRWFVKHSDEPRGIESLHRARQVYSTVRHPALPRLHNVFETESGLALVLEWLPGENLYEYTVAPGKAARANPLSPHARFCALPVRQVLEALDTIYDAHLALAGFGFVAVDFYDGCILYDFEQARTYLCDLDEYRPGPFINETDRLPGSRRFMAPEEFQRGARIDQVTNVFTLGRTALQLLGDGTVDDAWRGSPAMLAVVARATEPERDRRYQDVREFVDDWRTAVSILILG